jgi:ABC-2 type transport system ATP-binding protein
LAVIVDQVRYRYADGKRDALQNVSFAVEKGESFALLGPNGGGKTTLFKLLTGQDLPLSGTLSILGLAPERARAKLGVVFQNPSLDNKLTVRENMELQGALYGLSGARLARRVTGLLERYDVADRASDLAGSLSGGLKRRVELAKCLLHEPEVLLLDEPSTGLDPAARLTLWEHLLELGVTLIVTTHLMDEADRCRRLAILHQGKIVALGTPDSLKASIGGDVISISSPQPEAVLRGLREKFKLEAVVVEGSLRLEKPAGHVFIPQLVETFPGLISSVSLSKPTLEDVFVHHAGRRLG